MRSAAAHALRRAEQHRHRFAVARRQVPPSRGGHDRNEALHPLGMVDRDQLRDHAAHRGADDMGALRPERIDKSDRVIGHVVERVGNVRPLPRHHLRHQRARVRRRQGSEMSRLAGVAVVEPDHPKALAGKPSAKRLRPQDELGGEAHDQQDERIAVPPEALVFDVDSVGSDLRHSALQRLSSSTLKQGCAGSPATPARAPSRTRARVRRLRQASGAIFPPSGRRCSGGENLLRTAQDLSGLLRQDRERLARMPRKMRPVPASLPRQRLLGEQVRLEGMRVRPAVALRYSRTRAPSSTASAEATHLKPLS